MTHPADQAQGPGYSPNRASKRFLADTGLAMLSAWELACNASVTILPHVSRYR
jgi:hypothetical protein